jgi:hypothetical protein
MRRVGRKLMITPEGVTVFPRKPACDETLDQGAEGRARRWRRLVFADTYSARWKDISPDRDPGQQQPINALPRVKHIQMIIGSAGESMVVQYS